MATLIIEERPRAAALDLSLNGLPLGETSHLRSGDLLRAGGTLLRFEVGREEPTWFPLSRSSEYSRAGESSISYDSGGQPADPDSPSPRTAEDVRPQLAHAPELIAEAPSMRRLLERVRRVACGDSPVVLLGESGTGKDVLARSIHANGSRAEAPFVAVNAAALPESVIESELFGHERGAFTGASSRRRGLFEVANGGTLFLDEVGELPPTAQSKLLRVLENGEIRRVGGAESIRIDVRMIAATNRVLKREVEAGRFRADLYYRLAVVELEIPPLRERRSDLEPLCRHLLASLHRSAGGASLSISAAALEVLRGHPFPGNVRELRNVLEHAANFCDAGEIGPDDLPPQIRTARRGSDRFPTLAEVERDHVAAALARSLWNKTHAAALLGIDRKTLYAKIDAHGLKPGRVQSATEAPLPVGEPSSSIS